MNEIRVSIGMGPMINVIDEVVTCKSYEAWEAYVRMYGEVLELGWQLRYLPDAGHLSLCRVLQCMINTKLRSNSWRQREAYNRLRLLFEQKWPQFRSIGRISP